MNKHVIIVISIIHFLLVNSSTLAGEKFDYLDTDEIAGIGVGSAAMGGLGLWVKNNASKNQSVRWTYGSSRHP